MKLPDLPPTDAIFCVCRDGADTTQGSRSKRIEEGVMNWFRRPKTPEALEEGGLTGKMWLEFKSNWSFEYNIGHLLSEAALPMAVHFADAKYGPRNPRKTELCLRRSARVSGVTFQESEDPDNGLSDPDDWKWKGMKCDFAVEKWESTTAWEERFLIGRGYKNQDRVTISLALTEKEIEGLLMLATYEFPELPSARLYLDRASPAEDTSFDEIAFAVVSVEF